MHRCAIPAVLSALCCLCSACVRVRWLTLLFLLFDFLHLGLHVLYFRLADDGLLGCVLLARRCRLEFDLRDALQLGVSEGIAIDEAAAAEALVHRINT